MAPFTIPLSAFIAMFHLQKLQQRPSRDSLGACAVSAQHDAEELEDDDH